jgi:allophanate hydrolase subunit 2
MISKAELHLRARPLGDHRSLGIVEITHAGPRLAPHQEVSFAMAGRNMRAHVTGIRARPDRLPHVYADEIRAVAALEEEVAR